MKTLNILPVKDRRIFDPENDYAPVEGPVTVIATPFWYQALRDGDVKEETDDAHAKRMQKEAEKEEADAKAKAEKEEADAKAKAEKADEVKPDVGKVEWPEAAIAEDTKTGKKARFPNS